MKPSSRPRRKTARFNPEVEGLVGTAKATSAGVRRIPVFVVVPPRLLLLDIAGPLEVLRQANRVQSSIRFEVRYVGPSPSLQTSIGITLAGIEPLPEELPQQSWIVLAGDVEHIMLSGGRFGAGTSAEDEASEKGIVTWLKGSVRPGHK